MTPETKGFQWWNATLSEVVLDPFALCKHVLAQPAAPNRHSVARRAPIIVTDGSIGRRAAAPI